jgi:hypothetical protein
VGTAGEALGGESLANRKARRTSSFARWRNPYKNSRGNFKLIHYPPPRLFYIIMLYIMIL